MIIKIFLYRYALIYSRYNIASSNANRTKDEYYKDEKNEMLYRLNELEYMMNVIFENDIGADIRNEALTLANKFTEGEINAKLTRLLNNS